MKLRRYIISLAFYITQLWWSTNSQEGRNLITWEMRCDSQDSENYKAHNYYVDIYIGTPPHKKTLLLNVEAPFVGFTCSECAQCGTHINPPFNSAQSETAKIVQCDSLYNCQCQDNKCTFHIQFSEENYLEGYYLHDNVHLQEFDSTVVEDFTFVCITNETGMFYNQMADGIMGLDYSGLGTIPLAAEMKRKGIIADDQFSLCFGNDGGHLHFGGYNPSLNNQNEPINISMTINHGYFIEITDIKNGILTSSTSKSYFPHTIYKKILDTFRDSCVCMDNEGIVECERCGGNKEHKSHRCYEYHSDKFPTLIDFYATMPLIDLSFNNRYHGVIWYPSEYLMEEEENLYCVAIDAWE